MPTAVVPKSSKPGTKSKSGSKFKARLKSTFGSKSRSTRLILVTAAICVVVLLGLVIYLLLDWPFRYEAVVKQLEDESQSKVEAASYRPKYFPHPGCVLEHVTFRLNSDSAAPPLITVDKLAIVGRFGSLFFKHVKHLHAAGMHIVIPPRNAGAKFQNPQRSNIVIDELIADGVILEVTREDGSPPLKFSFQSFAMYDIGSSGPASFRAKFSNPEPPGEITAEGKFGPWNTKEAGQTPVSGKYLFQQADLSVFQAISGLLSSSGTFSGMIDHINVNGETDTPQFAVTSSSHQVDLHTRFQAVVNAENGDTFLEQVSATLWNTTVWSKGSIAGESEQKGDPEGGQKGKTATLELFTKDGRIEDVLLLFTKARHASMSGVTNFHASVSIPPGPRPFLKKVELQGDFGVDAGKFTNPTTRQEVNHLSEGALGEPKRGGAENRDKNEADPETVLSDLKGHVVLKDGTANLSDLSFRVPGASAKMNGTYNLITEKIDLHGHLKTESEPANSTTGTKALMLRVLNPFLKKKKSGYILPIKITGTYDQPSIGLDLDDHQTKRRQKKNWRALQLPTQAKP